MSRSQLPPSRENPFRQLESNKRVQVSNKRPMLAVLGVLFLICCCVLSLAGFALYRSAFKYSAIDRDVRRVDMDDHELIATAMKGELPEYDADR